MTDNRFVLSTLLLFLGVIAEPLVRQSDFVLVLIWGFFLFFNLNIWKMLCCKDFRILNFFLVSLGISSVISCMAVKGVIADYLDYSDAGNSTKFIRAFFWSIGLISSILYVEYIIKREKDFQFLELFFRFLSLYIILIDIHAIIFVPRSMMEKDVDYFLYIAGNKFDLSYTNIFFAIIYYKFTSLNGSFKRNVLYALIILAGFMSFYVKCSTSLIACAFMFIFALFRMECKHVFYKPSFFLVASVVCTLLLLMLSAYILATGSVKAILALLGESDDLTSRLYIWERMLELVEERPLWGFGQGNTGMIVYRLTNCRDSQNGVLELYFQYGIMGTILYFGIIIYFLKKCHLQMSSRAIVLLLYTLLVVSMVEIPWTFSMLFIVSFSMINNHRKSLGYNYK